MDYLDFDIEIREGDGHVYPVAARSFVGEGQTSAAFPFTDAELENHLLRLENAILRSAGRRGKALSEEESTVQLLGQQLFDFLLAGELRALYYEYQREADHHHKGVRLRLHIQPPLLAMLPWEFLYDPRRKDYICLDLHTPLVRYLDLAQRIPPLAVTPPLRILGMVASPRDLSALDVEQEKQRVERALHHLSEQGSVDLTWVAGPTWRDLQRVMRPGRGPWHIFHFIGHGGVDPARDEGFVMLADEQGQAHRVSALQLGRLLAGQRYSLRLVILNACEGARGSREDVLSSTAATLVRSGLPAVLAMQYAITNEAAVEFARSFYEALADGAPVDTAVADARNAINLRNEYSLEWGTPVLYMRTADGRIFTLTDSASPPPAAARSQPATDQPELPVAAEPEVSPPPLLANLGTILAVLYPAEASARRVVADAGISTSRIAFSPQAINNWRAILNEASKTGQVEDLVAVALREHNENKQLQEAAATWQTGPNEEQAPASVTASPPGVLRQASPASEQQREVAPKSQRRANVTFPIEFDWVTIPAGEFLMGSDKQKDSQARNIEMPQHPVYLPEYRIARVPVTNAQYKVFVKATGHHSPSDWKNGEIPKGKENHPVVHVTWDDTRSFCRWAGVRLPTEAEWEKAARGTDARIWPWGNEPPTKGHCNFAGNVADTTPVETYPKGASFYGVLDMAGNVWEWTSSLYRSYPYQADDDREDPESRDIRTLRGGSFDLRDALDVRCAARLRLDPSYRYDGGFRVVASGF